MNKAGLLALGSILCIGLHNTTTAQTYGERTSKPYELTMSMGVPSFVDIDHDGDLDLFALATGMKGGTIYFQRNNGSATAPKFGEKENRPFGLTKSMGSLAFVDIDNDGDLDVFGIETGMSGGTVFYQENTGNSASPAFSEMKSKPFGLNKSMSTPTFVDLDHDGDLDVVGLETGMTGGTVYYQENTGSKSAPAFGASQSAPFGFIRSMAALNFIDMDNDGDMDAFGVSTGFKGGTVYYQENKGTNVAPAFAAAVNDPFGIRNSLGAPAFVDIDGDGKLELFGIETMMGGGTIFLQRL